MEKAEILRDLKVIRAHMWSEDALAELSLLELHYIREAAQDPKGTAECMEALRQHLLKVLERLRAREEVKAWPHGNSVAAAAGAILHLESPYEEMEIEKVRVAIEKEKKWLKRDGKPAKAGNFRNIEDPKILQPFAEEFLQLEREQTGGGSNEEMIVPQLRQMESATYEERLLSIENGALGIRNEDEMQQILEMVIGVAKRGFKAVDSRPVEEWSIDLMNDFLERQLTRVQEDDLSLERIYLVDESEMDNPEFWTALARLVKRHEDGGGKLLLCPFKVARRMKLSFDRDFGFFLADGDGKEALGVGGMLSETSIGPAELYTRRAGPLLKYIKQYKRLAEVTKVAGGEDFKLRKRLPKSV
jgi:hypothetical protein